MKASCKLIARCGIFPVNGYGDLSTKTPKICWVIGEGLQLDGGKSHDTGGEKTGDKNSKKQF